MSEQYEGWVDSVKCDACDDSMLLGSEEVVEVRGVYYHDWCYEEARSEYRIAQEEARATMDKWEEEEV